MGELKIHFPNFVCILNFGMLNLKSSAVLDFGGIYDALLELKTLKKSSPFLKVILIFSELSPRNF